MRAENDGAPQTLLGETTGIPEGTYCVVGVVHDSANLPVTGKGPGRVLIANVAGAKWPGDANEVYVRAVGTLRDGSSVATGSFIDVATFGVGDPNQTTLTAWGESDVFVARYHADGRLTWAKRAGGADIEFGSAIAVLADGSTIVTGSFNGTATFGAGEPNETTLTAVDTSPAGRDVFVARYAGDGALTWAKRAGGHSRDAATAIAALPGGGSVVTGTFALAATFGAGEPNETALTSAGQDDIFVARYSADGSLAWAKSAGGALGDRGSGIATLPDGSCVAAGVFAVAATFGQGEPNETSVTSAGSADIFIARYAADGSLVWIKSAGGTALDGGNRLFSGPGIATMVDGTCVVTGQFQAVATFGRGEPAQTVLTAVGEGDIFVARYTAEGLLVWAKRAGGGSTIPNATDYGVGIAVLPDGSALVAGEFALGATFGAGEPRETTLYSDGQVGWTNAFVARYAADGSLTWAKRAGGTWGSGATALAVLADGSSVVVGWFRGLATFGSGEPRESTLGTSNVQEPSHTFTARFNADGGF